MEHLSMHLSNLIREPANDESELQFIYDKDLPPTPPHRLAYLKSQIEELMKIPQTVQKSEEWLRQRNSMITASDIGAVLGLNKNGDRESVLMSKVEPSFRQLNSPAIVHGVKYEDVANMIYAKRNGVTILEFGCIRHHTFPFVGASPDGIALETGVMVEIKVPSSRIINGIVPPYYYAQIQFQLNTCLLDRCDFLECKIIEYSEEEYEEDHFEGDYTKHSNGNEKGYVAEILNKETGSTSYEYAPIGIYGVELEEWKKEIMNKYPLKMTSKKIFSCFTPWFLDHVSCVPVYANSEWFHAVMPSVKSFWDDVEKYRVLGMEKCKEYVKKCREERKLKKQQQKIAEKKDRDIRDFMEDGEKIVSKTKGTKKGNGGNEYEDELNIPPSGCLFSEEDLKAVHMKNIDEYEEPVAHCLFEEEKVEKKKESGDISKKLVKKTKPEILYLFS
jgi:putative phage-type endonuclease